MNSHTVKDLIRRCLAANVRFYLTPSQSLVVTAPGGVMPADLQRELFALWAQVVGVIQHAALRSDLEMQGHAELSISGEHCPVCDAPIRVLPEVGTRDGYDLICWWRCRNDHQGVCLLRVTQLIPAPLRFMAMKLKSPTVKGGGA